MGVVPFSLGQMGWASCKDLKGVKEGPSRAWEEVSSRGQPVGRPCLEEGAGGVEGRKAGAGRGHHEDPRTCR